MVEKVAFGAMTIDGRTFTTDLMIFPDGRVHDDWWRASGHGLTLADIVLLVAHKPSVIIAGTGIYGRMRPEKDLQALLLAKGIKLITAWTKPAADRYNTMVQGRQDIAACFHLTC